MTEAHNLTDEMIAGRRPDSHGHLPEDMPRHVAPFDPEGTRAVVDEWSSEKVPLLPRIAWCCYRSAPIAAIGAER